jgi:hypothetical protein
MIAFPFTTGLDICIDTQIIDSLKGLWDINFQAFCHLNVSNDLVILSFYIGKGTWFS